MALIIKITLQQCLKKIKPHLSATNIFGSALKKILNGLLTTKAP
jgi:hypothetical protein